MVWPASHRQQLWLLAPTMLVALGALPITAFAVEGNDAVLPGAGPSSGSGVFAGRETPSAQAKPMAIEFTWDQYRSLVVVGDGIGLVRPAWVVTYDRMGQATPTVQMLRPLATLFGYEMPDVRDNLVVSYRAQAWLDRQGRLHIDARKAVIAGPQQDAWSPDSFMFTFPDQVQANDDNDSSNGGRIDRVVEPASDAVTYRALRAKAEAMVGDGI